MHPRSPLTVFVPHGASVASSRVRVYEWLSRTRLPVDLHVFSELPNNRPGTLLRHPLMTSDAVIRTHGLGRRIFDRVLIQREVSPFSAGGLEERVARQANFSVYDFDDALMWSPHSLTNPHSRLKAANCSRTVAAVDRVLAGSEVLAEWASTRSRDVRMIPTCVDPDAYGLKRAFDVGEVPRLVWLGSPSTEVYLPPIAQSLLEVNKTTGARLTVISAGNRSLGAIDGIVDRVEWYPGVEADLGDHDIAIAPLEDTLWARGKCAYKVLQFGAAGLPTVVSPVGANRTAARLLGMSTAETAGQWTDELTDMLRASPAQREHLGGLARKGVEAHYSYQRWERDWLRAVQG